MHLRPKTKRRIIVLLAVVICGGVIVGVLIDLQLRRLDQRRQAYRAAGMTAFDHGDYPAALVDLTKYLGDDIADPDAIYTYATSLSRVPSPDRSNLTRAISAYRRYLDLRPDDVKARRQLLDLYARSGFASEGLSLADQLLQADPNDVDALKAKIRLLELQSQYSGALDAAEALDRLEPDDLSNQMETYRLMHLAKKPPATLIARADAALAAKPTDARRVLLRAIAAYFADDPAYARQRLDAAANVPPPDAEFVRVLSNLFDRLGLYDRSLATLEKGADQRSTDAALLAALVLRQWEDGRCEDAAKRLNAVDASTSDSRLLGLKAMVLFSLAEEQQATTPTRPSTQPIEVAAATADLRSLEARSADEVAATWASLLHARFDRPPPRVRDRVRAYETVLVRDPDNAVAPFWLGFDDVELGERDMAVQAWQQAARLSPGWAMPHLLIARTLLDAGRIQEAAQAAQAAEDRAPDRLLVQTTLARAAYAQLPTDAPVDKLQPLLAFVGTIQSRVPNESETLPIYIGLLARTGRVQDATDALRRALSTTPPPSAATLGALLRVNDEQKLGLGRLIESFRNRNVSVTPADALTRAMAEADAGRPDDGLALLQDVSTANGPDSVGWRIALLRYRQYTADASALHDWAALGNDYPRNAGVQRAILASNLAWTDRPLIDRTITLLQKITGDEGVDWRLARARFELTAEPEGDPARATHATAAAAMLVGVVRDAPQSVEAQLLWAEARRQLGDVAGAVDHCRRAAELAPGDVDVSLALAPLLVRQGKTAEADAVLARAAGSPRLSRDQRLALGRQLAGRGQYAQATALLSTQLDRRDVDRDLLLAQICQAQGDAPAAAQLYAKLLNDGVATEPFIRDAAWFDADHGQPEAAKQVLAKLDASPLSPVDRDLLRADFEEAFEGEAAAKKRLDETCKNNPTSVAVTIALVGFDVRHRLFGVINPKFSNDTDRRVAAFEQLWAMLRFVPAGPEGDRLLADLSRDPLNEAARATLVAVANDPEKLHEVADRFPSYSAAQLLSAEQYLKEGAARSAAELLTRSAEIDPTDPAPLRASVDLYRSTGQWDALVSAATQWRRRSMQDPLPADLALADGYLHQNDADSALRQLSPYVAFAQSSPQSNQTVLRLYAGALAEAGRAEQARAVLHPLIGTSPAWRDIQLRVAAENVIAADVARDWISEIEQLAQPAERLSVAVAWASAGRRLNRPDFLATSRKQLTSITTQPNPPAAAWLALADVCRDVNDLPAAVAAYQTAVRLDPANASALNDYAFALLLTGGDLQTARGAAEAAVAARPADATFQTTLGRIELAAGDVPAAQKSLTAAVHADPTHRPALITLAELHARLHHTGELSAVLDQIEALSQTLPPPSADDTRRLTALHEQVAPAAGTPTTRPT